MPGNQGNPDVYWIDGLNGCLGSQSTEKETNGTSRPNTGEAEGTSDPDSTERNPWDVEDDMSMVQSHVPQDTEGMSFMSPFDAQSFAALTAPATTTSDSGTASAQADRTLRDVDRNDEQARPQSGPNRVGQSTSAQDGRQQTVTPAENAWDFVRSPEFQTPVNPSSGLAGEAHAPRIQAGRSTTGSNGESQLPYLENASSNMNYMERPNPESLLRAGFLENGSAERHQHPSDPDVTIETPYHEQDDMSMIQPCEQAQAHATTGGVDFMLPFNFESQNSNVPASTRSAPDIDAAQIGHALADSN